MNLLSLSECMRPGQLSRNEVYSNIKKNIFPNIYFFCIHFLLFGIQAAVLGALRHHYQSSFPQRFGDYVTHWPMGNVISDTGIGKGLEARLPQIFLCRNRQCA